MDQRLRLAEDITGEDISDNRAKSVLIGILDPLTRQHTAMHQGQKTSYQEFKKIVLEFANNTGTNKDAMQVGRVEQDKESEYDSSSGWEPEYEEA